jgi:hypothetical protein
MPDHLEDNKAQPAALGLQLRAYMVINHQLMTTMQLTACSISLASLHPLLHM